MSYNRCPQFPRGSFLSSFGNTVSYQYLKEGNNRPNVILLHGIPNNSNYWNCLMKALAPTANVYAPDLPGFGLTPFPPTTDHILDDLTTGLIEMMDHIKVNRAYFVGHGIGALMALNLAVLQPQRVIQIVAASANPQWILSPGSTWQYPISAQLQALLAQINQPGVNLTQLAIQVNNLTDPINCPAREYLVANYVSSADAYLRYQNLIADIDFRQKASQVRVPVLLMSGQLDPIAPTGASLYLRNTIPNSAIVEFPNQGHNFPIFNTKLFNLRVYDYFFCNCDPCYDYLKCINVTGDETYVPDCSCHSSKYHHKSHRSNTSNAPNTSQSANHQYETQEIKPGLKTFSTRIVRRG